MSDPLPATGRTPAGTYQRIAADLAALIESGTIGIGARMPTAARIAARYDVGPATAGRALQVLVADGVLHSMGGRGLYVRRKPSAARRIRDRREQEIKNDRPSD